MAKRKIIPLKNGAVLLYKKRTINKSVSFRAYFTVGASNSNYMPGMLHFGEHLRCKKTADKTVAECDDLAYKLGMGLNGGTGWDSLSFYAFNSNKQFAPTLKLMAEKMLNTSVTDEEFENEKKVIYSEIDNYKDNDERNISKNTIQTAIQNPYYFCNVLGEKSDLEAYDQTTVQNHISSVINSNHLVASVAGNISAYRAKRLVNKYILSHLPTTKPTVTRYDDELVFQNNSNLTIATNSNTTCTVTISFPVEFYGKLYGEKDAQILNSFITRMFNEKAGIILKQLRTLGGLIYSGYSYCMIHKNKGLFTIYYKTSKPNVNKSLEMLASVTRNLQITKEQYDDIKFKVELGKDKRMPNSLDQTTDKMFYNFRTYGKFHRGRIFEKIYKSITIADINTVLNRLFQNNKVFVHVFGNATENDVFTMNQIHNLFFNQNKMALEETNSSETK